MSSAPKPLPHPDSQHPDAPVPWHYGDPHREQRNLEAGVGYVDVSHRGVIAVTGPDRLTWLHSLLSQSLDHLASGQSALALLLDANGRVQRELHVVDDGRTTWLITEPGAKDDLLTYLDRMRFLLQVEVSDESDSYSVVWQPVREPHSDYATWLVPESFAGLPAPDAGGDWQRLLAPRPAAFVGREVLVPRRDVEGFLSQSGEPAGTWALEALRVAAGVPREALDIDDRTIPNEMGWLGPAVHLSKGCYRGQETVARTHNLGRPPRRLVLLHLDGSTEQLPERGEAVLLDGKQVGTLGSVARHYELGPIALAVIKRSVPLDAVLLVGDVSATQQPILIS